MKSSYKSLTRRFSLEARLRVSRHTFSRTFAHSHFSSVFSLINQSDSERRQREEAVSSGTRTFSLRSVSRVSYENQRFQGAFKHVLMGYSTVLTRVILARLVFIAFKENTILNVLKRSKPELVFKKYKSVLSIVK